MKLLLHSLKMNNLLSFGPNSEAVQLGPLNVLIGPNASGKSNFMEGISLLQAAPTSLVSAIREGGGVNDWLWKGGPKKTEASLEAIINNPYSQQKLRYSLIFVESNHRFQIIDERIENKEPYSGESEKYFYYRYENGHPVLNVKGEETRRMLRREDIDPEQSILSQRKDPDHYPVITYLGAELEKIRFYREWSFGRKTPPRLPQKPDLPNRYLDEDGANLGHVLNRIGREPTAKNKLLNNLKPLYEGIDDYHVNIDSGSVQVFLHEGKMTIPATRLSDGTLRYLYLLAILTHPSPPPLVCIEEPELGLHPDVLGNLAQLLLDASQRMQLIVTTHSDLLVDALTEAPESIIVCEKWNNETCLKRLDRERLLPWLNRYRLGELWIKGEIGGTRW